MKLRIQNNVKISKLKDLVPTAYRELAKALEVSVAGNVTLVVFPHNRKDLVKRSMVMKALGKIGEIKEELVVVGGSFSNESIEILLQHQSHVLNLSEFPWSEERYNEIKSGAPKSRDMP